MRRRDFLAAIPISAIGAVTLALGRSDAMAGVLAERSDPRNVPDSAAGSASDSEHLLGGAAPWWLIAPLGAGDEVGLGWHLESLTPVRRGAAALWLTRGGERARVDVCARRGRAHGIASTRQFDLVLMNDADGSSVTDESLGRAIKTLGSYLARNERDQPRRVAAALQGMLPHEVRVARYIAATELSV